MNMRSSSSDRSFRAVLGTFDGFHAGHRALFSRAAELSRADGLFTAAVVIHRTGDGRLCSPEERDALLREAGASRVFVFDLEQIRGLTCEDFVLLLRERCGVCACVCGYNFRFGRDRAGDAKTLGGMIPTEVVDEQTVEGMAVSSTAIRKLLSDGDVQRAGVLLCRPYRIRGVVEHGKQLGRTMGFPTANVSFPEGYCVPRNGVYATRVGTPDGVWNAVTNVGTRPTVNGTGVNAESCLLDYQGDLYGERISVEFLSFLREETRFESVEALREQILRDVSGAEEYFKNRV